MTFSKRSKQVFTIDHSFRQKLLHWANQFKHVCILDSNTHLIINNKQTTNNYELIAAVDSVEEIIPAHHNFESLKEFIDKKEDWIFGFFSYDLKNEVENLSSGKPDNIGFPLMHFFRPKYVFILTQTTLEVQYISELSSKSEIEYSFNQINHFNLQPLTFNLQPVIPRITKEQYINNVRQLQHHIQLGDIYEINFCQEFYADRAEIDPVIVFEKLNTVSLAPFSAYYRLNDKYLICASPERFIKKTGQKIISQPIKGTRKRGRTQEEDEALKHELLSDEKERSENVMIVDLVRNDLSRTAKRGTVNVDELFGVYTFNQVHQLISTVSAEIKEGTHPVDVIKNAFPMGSMTGAPKVRAMELIEEYESMKRGLFSGSAGYFTPEGDFDFNVVIRSILYNSSSNYLSFCTGGAITAKAKAEEEFEECMVKAKAMFEVLAEYI